MYDPAECTPKLHFYLRVGGTPRPPFPPGSPGLINKVQQGGRATGFVVCHLQTRVTRAQLESCTDLSYNLFELRCDHTFPTSGAIELLKTCPIFKPWGGEGVPETKSISMGLLRLS